MNNRLVCLSLTLVMSILQCPAFAQRQQKSEPPLSETAYHRAYWALDNAYKVHFKHNQNDPIEQVEKHAITGAVTANTDSSGFASWVLYGTSPDRLFAIEELEPGQQCPQPKTFARFFASLNPEKPSKGWLGLTSATDLRRGDFIAWSGTPKGKDGHVMVVAEAPTKVEETTVNGRTVRYVSVKVIDSADAEHFGPEVLPPLAAQKRRDGLGSGYIRLVLDEQGRASAHWDGSEKNAEPTPSPVIAFGRLVGKANFPDVKAADINAAFEREKQMKRKATGGLYTYPQ